MSYTRIDDDYTDQKISQLRDRLSIAVQVQTGSRLRIFQPHHDIQWGQHTRNRIAQVIQQVSLFIPVITPSYFTDADCRTELALFLEREQQLGRTDLVLPILYLKTPLLTNPGSDALARTIAERRPADWCNLRAAALDSPEVRTFLEQMAAQVIERLDRATPPPPSPTPPPTSAPPPVSPPPPTSAPPPRLPDDPAGALIDLIRQGLDADDHFHDVSGSKPHAAFDLIGFRDTNLFMELVACVKADALTHEEIVSLRDAFFEITRRLPREYLKPGARNPNGLLCFIFARGCSPKMAAFIAKQTKISHAATDGGLIVSWALDMQSGQITTHNNPVSLLPPVFILAGTIFPNDTWLQQRLRDHQYRSG